MSKRSLGLQTFRVALAPCKRPSQSAISKWEWGFHTVRGGVYQKDLRFRPRGVGELL